MSTSLRARTDHRAIADQRLSDLTLATAVAGLAATIGFGWLAAVTYAGVATPLGADPAQNTIDTPRTLTGTNPSTTGGSTTTRPRITTGGGTSLGGGSSSGTSRGRAHVSTGSS